MTGRVARVAVEILTLVVLAAAPVGAAGRQDAQSGAGPSPALDQLKQGFVAMGEGAYDAALGHYRTALDLANTRELRFQALVGIGSAQAALANLGEAREAYDRALEIKPDNPETLFAAGMIAKDQEELDEAAELFAQAAVRKPGFGEALTQLGIVYEFQGRHDEAAATCWKAVSVAPEDTEALLCLGVARYHLGLYAKAAQAFEAVIELDPESARARYSLGLCKLYMGDARGAITAYGALEKLDPELAADLHERILSSQ